MPRASAGVIRQAPAEAENAANVALRLPDGAVFSCLPILVKADFYEEDAGESAVWSAYHQIFRTASGKRLLRLIFGIEENE